MMHKQNPFLQGKAIDPRPLASDITVVDLVERHFLAYNAGRLREICQLFVEKMLQEDVVVGMSLSGALTPAGLASCLIPLLQKGLVDWIVSTGANLYHDTHFGIGLKMHQGSPFLNDTVLQEHQVVRIYDILFDYDVLLSTDRFFREILSAAEFQKEMGTAEFHFHIGKYVSEREKALGLSTRSLLSVAYQMAVPIYTSSPGDSSIGMNMAALALQGNKLKIDVNRDVNETAAIVYQQKQQGGKSGVFILGGGSPKNFLLQTEPQIQEVLKLPETGHDYFIQITDARPDTGGLSGATPSEAVSWNKVNPATLPDSVVAYVDTTIALPIITAYTLAKHPGRKPKRLYEQRETFITALQEAYLGVNAAGRGWPE
jgi:deoxyhypusine synthase